MNEARCKALTILCSRNIYQSSQISLVFTQPWPHKTWINLLKKNTAPRTWLAMFHSTLSTRPSRENIQLFPAYNLYELFISDFLPSHSSYSINSLSFSYAVKCQSGIGFTTLLHLRSGISLRDCSLSGVIYGFTPKSRISLSPLCE